MRVVGSSWPIAVVMALGALVLITQSIDARPSIRNAFQNAYPSTEGSRLDDLPSNSNHCGVCHFDFGGGGSRNPYGLAVQVAINSGQFGSDEEAILSIEHGDQESDGFSSVVEILDTSNFDNTPTFPGLSAANVGDVSGVNVSEIIDYLTPSGGSDVTPPSVTVLSPDGGEVFDANTVEQVTWLATDASGIAHVDFYFSDDGGVTFKPIARGEENDGTYDWFVPNRPGGLTRIRVVARDNAGLYGSDDSAADFTLTAAPAGVVPTTLRDFDLPGTQPLEGGILEDPSLFCRSCHGDYDEAVEPYHNWEGSMMGNAMRDPLFTATMVIAEQDAPSSGDLCLRCHTPGGWQEGRSVDTTGGLLIEKDFESVQCDFCHRMVDPDYEPGQSPPIDLDILNDLDEIPLNHANGQFVTDPDPIRRGPYADAGESHAFLESPFHRSSDLCGTCHDVSNPVFVSSGMPGMYEPNGFDAPHPDGDLRNMFPVERTFSEWTQSDYANGGVFAPEFAGDKPDGIVSTCQDCHMRDVTGEGCNEPGAPTRPDLPLHDMMGANHFVPDILPVFFPGQVDVDALQDAKARAIALLQLAATLDLVGGQEGPYPTVEVTVTNQSAHKLPSGYPEGRRIWLNIKAYDDGQNLVYESGAYDVSTGELDHDEDLKIYHIEPGISVRLGSILGVPAGPSFHFVLNDSIYEDNRIPARGFTNANYEAIQSPPVGHSYADGQYWDTTLYTLPGPARHVDVTLYYQTTSKEYIEFLRDENTTNTLGQELYDAWVDQGRATPVAMVTASIDLDVVATGSPEAPVFRTALEGARPNPFNPTTRISYTLDSRGPILVGIYDPAGRLVQTLVDEIRDVGRHTAMWDGTAANGARVASGTYFIRMQTSEFRAVERIVLLK